MSNYVIEKTVTNLAPGDGDYKYFQNTIIPSVDDRFNIGILQLRWKTIHAMEQELYGPLYSHLTVGYDYSRAKFQLFVNEGIGGVQNDLVIGLETYPNTFEITNEPSVWDSRNNTSNLRSDLYVTNYIESPIINVMGIGFADQLKVTRTSTSLNDTDVTQAALSVEGGATVKKNLNVGTNVSAASLSVSGDTAFGGDLLVSGSSSLHQTDITGGASISLDLTVSRDMTVVNDAQIGSDMTVGGSVVVDQNAFISGIADIIGTTNIGGDASITGAASVAGIVTAQNTTDSTSITTGSLVTAGGLGVAKNVVIGGTIDSTSYNTGSIVTKGGVGIEKNLTVGAVINGGSVVSGLFIARDAAADFGRVELTAAVNPNCGNVSWYTNAGATRLAYLGFGNPNLNWVFEQSNGLNMSFASGTKFTKFQSDGKLLIGASSLSDTATAELEVDGKVRIRATNDNVSSADVALFANGAIYTIGDIATAGTLYAGANANVTGDANITGNVIVQGAIIAQNTTAATATPPSTFNGSLKSDGGCAIKKNLIVGEDVRIYGDVQIDGSLTYAAGTFDSLNITNDVAVGGNISATNVYNTNCAHTISTGLRTLDYTPSFTATTWFTTLFWTNMVGGTIVLPSNTTMDTQLFARCSTSLITSVDTVIYCGTVRMTAGAYFVLQPNTGQTLNGSTGVIPVTAGTYVTVKCYRKNVPIYEWYTV